MAKSKKSVNGVISDVIRDRIKSTKKIPWVKPWMSMGRPQQNIVSKRPYRGINALLTGFTDFTQPYWVTFDQAAKNGGTVKKDEHATPVLLWKPTERKAKKDTPGAVLNEHGDWVVRGLFSRYYRVFNVEQTEGLEHLIPEEPELVTPDPHEAAESAIRAFGGFCERENIEFTSGGDRAFYRPATDGITLPKLEQFTSRVAYAATAWHEGVHATGAKHRLNRDEVTGLTLSTFGSPPYAREELVAEIGAAMMAEHFGFGMEHVDQSAAYVQGWLKALEDDDNLIVSAAQRAQKAVDYILAEDES